MKKNKNDLTAKAMDLIRETLGADYACYVLIACSEPSSDGNMNVEMQYEGDEILASFLVNHAGQRFEMNQELYQSQ
jgi:hypothetical protein